MSGRKVTTLATAAKPPTNVRMPSHLRRFEHPEQHVDPVRPTRVVQHGIGCMSPSDLLHDHDVTGLEGEVVGLAARGNDLLVVEADPAIGLSRSAGPARESLRAEGPSCRRSTRLLGSHRPAPAFPGRSSGSGACSGRVLHLAEDRHLEAVDFVQDDVDDGVGDVLRELLLERVRELRRA